MYVSRVFQNLTNDGSSTYAHERKKVKVDLVTKMRGLKLDCEGHLINQTSNSVHII